MDGISLMEETVWSSGIKLSSIAFGIKLSSIQALPLQGCALLNILHNLSVPWYPLLPLKVLGTV